MADQHGTAAAKLSHGCRDIAGEHVQGEIVHRPGRCAHAARLRAQHLEAEGRQAFGKAVEIFRVALRGRQQHHGRSPALDDDIDADGALGQQNPLARGPRRCERRAGAHREGTGQRAECGAAPA